MDFTPPPASATEVASSHLVARIWRGELDLGEVFFVYGVMGNLIITFFFMWLERTMDAMPQWFARVVVSIVNTVGEKGWVLLLAGLTLLALAYSVLTMVGIWRSANRFEGRPLFAVLAKAFVLIGAMRTILELLLGLGESV